MANGVLCLPRHHGSVLQRGMLYLVAGEGIGLIRSLTDSEPRVHHHWCQCRLLTSSTNLSDIVLGHHVRTLHCGNEPEANSLAGLSGFVTLATRYIHNTIAEWPARY
jgi:hypothetical protein